MKEYEPDAVFPESNIIEKATFDGIGFSCAKEYGVGMDCRRPFIQVNVLFWNNGTILKKGRNPARTGRCCAKQGTGPRESSGHARHRLRMSRKGSTMR